MKVLLTGGAGYIGSHTCVELLNSGYEVVIADNFDNANEKVLERITKITGKTVTLYKIDVADKKALRELFSQCDIDAVIHFAGYKAVGESVEKPVMYYRNNIDTTLTLLEVMKEFGVNKIVFSSSATVYGIPKVVPLKEGMPTSCTNPYGWTKLFNEQIQLDLARDGSYGPVYNCDGTLIDFCCDDTVCRNIVIENNIFKCAGFPAIGHHGNCDHNHITIRGNIFEGPSGHFGKSRGYIFFRPDVHSVHVHNNAFIAANATDSPNIGIIAENTDQTVFTAENNVFIGHFDDCFVGGITAENNIFQ